MSELSEYLNARVPSGWTKTDVIDALNGRVDRTTVYRYLSGRHPRRPSEAVLAAFAAVLPGTTVVELRQAAGHLSGEEEPWVLPPEANRLNLGQRRAIEAFIRATVGAEGLQDAAQHRSTDSESEYTDDAPAPIEVTPSARADLENYIGQLYASGREDLAERLAAALAMSSASDIASRSASD